MAWNSTGNIRGPQGVQGIQGPKGDTGPQGPAGDPAKAKPGIITSYYINNLTNQTTSSINGVTVGSGAIPRPLGVSAYYLRCYGNFEVGNFAGRSGKAVIEVRAGSTSGPVIARGMGPNTQDWSVATVVPVQAARLTAASTTIYVILLSAFDNVPVQVTTYYASLCVDMVAVEYSS